MATKKKIVPLSRESKKNRHANATCRLVLIYSPERSEAWIRLWDLLLARSTDERAA